MPGATVIGGGIAGLATATSLLQAGWAVTVLERAPAFAEVGAGVAITGNGMAALDAIGVGDAVRGAGHMTRPAGFQDRRGRWVMRIPQTPVDRNPTTWVCAIHRQRLHAALLNAAAGATLVTGARVTDVHPGMPTGAPATVTWLADDEEHIAESDLIIAADGVHSIARATLFPDVKLAYSGSTSWRAVIEDTTVIDDRFIAMWGPGTEFGALRISDTEVYWYGYFRHPAGLGFDDELAAARDTFAGWSTLVTDVVAATAPSQLIRHDVYHLPKGPSEYVRGRVALAGDAAHAVLPTMGQGVATCLEDAVSIGQLIGRPTSNGDDLSHALSTYDLARRPRCQQIARQSRMIARLGVNVTGGWHQAARNTVLRLIPARLLVAAGETQVLRWTPPITATTRSV